MADLAGELHGLGVFNMLLTDSRTLYAHCGKRLCYLTRRAPFGKATLIDEDWQVDFAEETTEHDVVTVIATQALTRDECWTDLARGDVLTLRDGAIRLLRPAQPSLSEVRPRVHGRARCARTPVTGAHRPDFSPRIRIAQAIRLDRLGTGGRATMSRRARHA